MQDALGCWARSFGGQLRGPVSEDTGRRPSSDAAGAVVSFAPCRKMFLQDTAHPQWVPEAGRKPSSTGVLCCYHQFHWWEKARFKRSNKLTPQESSKWDSRSVNVGKEWGGKARPGQASNFWFIYSECVFAWLRTVYLCNEFTPG